MPSDQSPAVPLIVAAPDSSRVTASLKVTVIRTSPGLPTIGDSPIELTSGFVLSMVTVGEVVLELTARPVASVTPVVVTVSISVPETAPVFSTFTVQLVPEPNTVVVHVPNALEVPPTATFASLKPVTAPEKVTAKENDVALEVRLSGWISEKPVMPSTVK